MTSRLWNREIDSVSTVVYLQQSDSRRLTVQQIQHKCLGTPNVIGDTWSERETLPLVILNSLISIISNSGIIAMSAPFRLNWYISFDYDFWLFSFDLWSQFHDFFERIRKSLIDVQNRQISRLSDVVTQFWYLYVIQMIWSSS
jgi:hypothetical protein